MTPMNVHWDLRFSNGVPSVGLKIEVEVIRTNEYLQIALRQVMAFAFTLLYGSFFKLDP